MIGNKKIFVFGDGTMSTLNLQHKEGNRYALLEDEDGTQGQINGGAAQPTSGTEPHDPGA